MSIKSCIKQVEMFNDIAGNLSHVSHNKLVAQGKVVREEALELCAAVATEDKHEILKECVDVLVTIHGFVKMLEQQGYNVLGAFEEVNVNNLDKFTSSLVVAEQSVAEYAKEGTTIDVTYNEFYGVYVLKDLAGKIRKPISYEKCSVEAFVPKGGMPC